MTEAQSPHSRSGVSAWAAALTRWTVILAAAGVVFFLVWRINQPPPQITDRPLSKLELSPLTESTSQPSSVLTLSDLKGQVALINYWGTWCPPCRLEFPHLVALEKKIRSHQEFRLVFVSCGQSSQTKLEDLKSQTEVFLAEQGYRSPVYCDPDGKSQYALARSAGLNDFAFPTTVLLDRQGMIQGLWRGYTQRSMEDIERRTMKVLGEGA